MVLDGAAVVVPYPARILRGSLFLYLCYVFNLVVRRESGANIYSIVRC